MKKTKNIWMIPIVLSMPIGLVAATISCSPGVQKSDLSIMIDSKEINLYAPRIKAFEKVTGLKVKIISQDPQTVLTDLQVNKISQTMPDIVLAGDPGALRRSGYSSMFKLVDLFDNDTFINTDLSSEKFEKPNSDTPYLDMYKALNKKYDLGIFKSSAGFGRNIQAESDAKAFLESDVSGLPVGITGWGMWIRENQLKGYDSTTNKMMSSVPIKYYLNHKGSETLLPTTEQGNNMKEFLIAYTKKVYKKELTSKSITSNVEILKFAEKRIFFDIKPSTDTKDDGNYGTAEDGKGYFMGTADGIQAFVAASQWKGLANENLENNGWYSLGATGQFQRTNAAIYNAKKSNTQALWDGYLQRLPLAEKFNSGIPSVANSLNSKNEWKNLDLTQNFYSIAETTNDIVKKWFLMDTVYSGKGISTNEQYNGVNDPATGFWFPQKDKQELSVALVKGQQWQSWPLASELNTEKQIDAVKSVKTIAIPFKTPGLQAYAFSSQLSSKPVNIQLAARKLFRMLFSKKSLEIVAGKLQSVMIDNNGESISKDVTSKNPKSKNYLARGLFTDVTLSTEQPDKVYSGGKLGYSSLEKFDDLTDVSKKAGAIDFFKNYTPITEEIRKLKNKELNIYANWKKAYKKIVDIIRNNNNNL